MGNKKTIFAATVLSAALITGGSAIAFAETAADSAEAYGYTAGQQKYAERHAKFEKVPEFTTDEEREAYFAEQGIGRDENPYDTAEGETADTSDYSYTKGRRHSAGEYDGKNIEEQLADGTITQEEADAIKAEAGRKHDEIHSRFAEQLN